MPPKLEYLKVKFILGTITLIIGFLGGNIALFQWEERIGVQYLLGEYARYMCGFGGFAAMIFGAMLVNDAWVLRNVLMGKYEPLSLNERAPIEPEDVIIERELGEKLEVKEKETAKG